MLENTRRTTQKLSEHDVYVCVLLCGPFKQKRGCSRFKLVVSNVIQATQYPLGGGGSDTRSFFFFSRNQVTVRATVKTCANNNNEIYPRPYYEAPVRLKGENGEGRAREEGGGGGGETSGQSYQTIMELKNYKRVKQNRIIFTWCASRMINLIHTCTPSGKKLGR